MTTTFLTGTAVLPKQLHDMFLGGYMENTSTKAFSGLPVEDVGNQTDIVTAKVAQGMALSKSFQGASGSIIMALNHAIGEGTYSGGDGIAVSDANVISFDADDSTLGVNGSGKAIVKSAGITATQIAASVAGDGLAGGAGTALSVNVDDSSLEIDSDSLRVKASGITNAMLAGSIANGKLANSTISGVSLGSNLNDLTVDNSTLQLDSGTTLNGGSAKPSQ